MALIRCRECGKKISEFCGTCPNCGYPIESCTPNKEENDTVKGCSNENNISGNEFSNEESNKTAGMPNEESNYDLKQPKQMELSYTQKKNQLVVRIVSISIFVLIGIAFIAYPLAHKNDIIGAVRWDWYSEARNNDTYETTIEKWYNEYLETDEGSDDKVFSIDVVCSSVSTDIFLGTATDFTRYIHSKLSGRVFMKELPYFIGGVACFVVAGYLVSTLKRYALVRKDEQI